MKIVFIHGYKGIPRNYTFRKLKQMLPGATCIAEQYDLIDTKAVLSRISELQPDVLVGNSLGGMYTLVYDQPCRKIVINPCMKPSVDIPPLDLQLNTVQKSELVKLEKMLGNRKFNDVYGIFAKDDELFHHKDDFDSRCEEPCSILVEGTHKLKDPGLGEGLKKAVEYLELQ